MNNELWLPIKNYPDYEVSSFGRIKRVTSVTCAKSGTILKTPERSKTRPYLCVDLCCNGKKKTISVHALVAAAFLGEPPFEGAEVNHLDGNKRNPRADNLEWSTSSGNKLHAYREGLSCAKGEGNGRSKLVDENIYYIRSGLESDDSLAVKFSVSTATIRDVISRRTWKHLP